MNTHKPVVTMGQHPAARYVDSRDIFVTRLLAEQSKRDPKFLEVGVLLGGWVIHFLMNVPAAQAVGIDPFPGEEGPLLRAGMLENVKRFGVDGQFLHVVSWDEVSSAIGPKSFDIIHIDGDHSENAVLDDLKRAETNLTETGFLILDDWHHPMFPGVGSALHRFMASSDFRVFAVTNRKAFLCRKDQHEGLQRYLVEHLSFSEALEWCWQHGRVPPESRARGGKQSSEALGHVAGYEIENTVLGYRVMLILGEQRIVTRVTSAGLQAGNEA